MDNEDMYSKTSRAEMIRLARESCSSRLEGQPYNKQSSRREKNNSEELLSEAAFRIRFFIIRLLCAVFIFAAFVLIDYFNVSYNDFSSEKIVEYIRNNDSIENLEDYISSYISNTDYTQEKN